MSYSEFGLFLDTEYELTDSYFSYRSGPIKKKIGIDRKNEIIKRTIWIENWPSTSRKGLIIKNDKYNLINISPVTNENFITKVLEINKSIKITKQCQPTTQWL